MPSIPFPEPAARRDGPMGWAEPSVSFYLKSTRPVASVGRATINDWYSRFPDPNGAFLGRIRSAEDADHEGALDEPRHDRLADELDKRVSPDRWGLNFEIIRMDRTPSARRLATWVRRTVDALPPHDRTQPRPF